MDRVGTHQRAFLSRSMRNLGESVGALSPRRLMREGTWIIAGHATAGISGVLSVRLFTELAPPAVFGGANLLIGMLGLATHVLIAPITQTQIRYHTVYQAEGIGDQFTGYIARLNAASATAIIVLVSIGLQIWPDGRIGGGSTVPVWLGLWTAVWTIKAVLINRLNAERRQKLFALWAASDSILVLLSTSAMLVLWPTIEAFIAGQVIGMALTISLFGTPLLHSLVRAAGISASSRQAARQQVLSYGLPFIAFGILGWVSHLSERYVLAAYVDVAAVGQYAAAYAIASKPPMLASAVLNDLFRPILFTHENQSDSVGAQRLFLGWLFVMAFAMAMVLAMFILWGDMVANLLLAESYREGAKEIMYWITTGYGALALAQIVENRVLSFGKSHALIWSKLVGATSNICIAMIAIPAFGVKGAVYASTIGLVLQLAVTVLICTRLPRMRTIAIDSSDVEVRQRHD
jgi:O-antigen/teichoic acid export membrane protein